jgi:hypothetical protein
MLYRILFIVSLFLLPPFVLAQMSNVAPAYSGQRNGFTSSTPSLPSQPWHGKWQVEEFKPTDAAVSCSVVQYDLSQPKPILHLLCPGPQIFAPLRVHLALTWKKVTEVPSQMKSMLIDLNRLVKFKSRPGNSKVEITFRAPQTNDPQKEWVSFTSVNVGLVLNNDR